MSLFGFYWIPYIVFNENFLFWIVRTQMFFFPENCLVYCFLVFFTWPHEISLFARISEISAISLRGTISRFLELFLCIIFSPSVLSSSCPSLLELWSFSLQLRKIDFFLGKKSWGFCKILYVCLFFSLGITVLRCLLSNVWK